jgi:hypothetical protein
MTGIDELRRTLEQHATDVAESDVVSRTVGVHHRIDVVRRRRRAAVATGAVAALAIAGGVALLPGSDDPDAAAQRTVVGVEAPARMTSLDYTYGFDRVVEGDGRTAVVELAPSDEPRLVSWATSGDNDEVTVRSDAGEVRASSPDFSDFVLVEPGSTEEVRVRADAGSVGLAVYELTDDAPAGFTEDGVTFRQHVEDRTLVDAAVGDLGDSDLSLEVSTPAGGVAYSELCVGAPEGARLRVGRGADGHVESDCNAASRFDPGVNASEFPNLPASDEPVRVWVVDEQGNPIDDPNIRLGIGVYVVNPGNPSGAGQDVPGVVEQDGHRWRLEKLHTTEVGATMSARLPADGPRLVTFLVSGDTDEVTPLVDGEGTGFSYTNGSGGPASFGMGQLDPGSLVTIPLDGAPAGLSAALAVYKRGD